VRSFIKNRMGCQGNKFIVPSPSVDFTTNNQILKYQCPYYKNMWVYKNPTRGDDFTFWPMDYKLFEHYAFIASLLYLFSSTAGEMQGASCEYLMIGDCNKIKIVQDSKQSRQGLYDTLGFKS